MVEGISPTIYTTSLNIEPLTISSNEFERMINRKAKNKAVWGTIGTVAAGVAIGTSSDYTTQTLGILTAASLGTSTAVSIANDLKYRNFIYDEYLKRTSLEPNRVAMGYILFDVRKTNMPLTKNKNGYKQKITLDTIIQVYGASFIVEIDLEGKIFKIPMKIDYRMLKIDISRM